MKNMPTSVGEQLRRLGKRASIIERQCCAAAKLDDASVLLDIFVSELDGVYAAISMALDEVPCMDEQHMSHLTDETLAVLCKIEQSFHDCILQWLARDRGELSGFLAAQEQHCRTKLAALYAEMEFRRSNTAGKKTDEAVQLTLVSA